MAIHGARVCRQVKRKRKGDGRRDRLRIVDEKQNIQLSPKSKLKSQVNTRKRLCFLRLIVRG
jgi:hypothetical protein